MVRGRGHHWTLDELEAKWLDAPDHRYNVGFSFTCPSHGTHRLTVRFDVPYDGFEPVEGEGLLVHRVESDEGGSLGAMTLEMPSGYDVLNFNDMGHGACGRYRILEGSVERVRFTWP